MKRKMVCYILVCVNLCLLLLLGMQYDRRRQLQESIAEKVVRFHVLANSDEKADQELKLKVRDAVGTKMAELLADAQSKEECEQIVRREWNTIECTAEQVIEAEGYDYDAEMSLSKVKFPAKQYGNYIFPAGTYEALEIIIGKGEGHNWWCVMYPNMCFAGSVYEVVDEDASEALREVLSDEEYEKVLTSGNYDIQFKYLSFLNELTE